MIDAATRDIEPANIPTALTQRAQWVTWKTEERDGKATKIPYNARTQNKAQSTNSGTWSPFGVALSAARRGYDGPGFVFSDADPFCGIDLDGCRDPETGHIAEWARDIIADLDTYTEVSPSKTGVKLFARGTLPKDARKKWKVKDAPHVCEKSPGVEMYDRGRYFAVTGWRLDGPSEPQERQVQVDALLAKYQPKRTPPQNGQNGHDDNGGAASSVAERAQKYLAKVPGAVAGQFGHDATFAAACVLVLDFNMTPDEAWPIFVEWNQKCDPPWSEHELHRKLDEANKRQGERGAKLVAERNGKAARKAGIENQHHRKTAIMPVGDDATDLRAA